MIDNVLNLIFLVDLSSNDNSVIASIKENIREIISELQVKVNTLSLIVFSNLPNIIAERMDQNDFDIQSIPQDLGGMCNVHYALSTTTQLVDESSDAITCILLFSTSDPTDTDRPLTEHTRHLLSNSEKYLIKKNSTLLEPTGFDGSRTYISDVKDIERLIRDLKDLCNTSGTIASEPTSTYDSPKSMSDTDTSEDNGFNPDIEIPEMKDHIEGAIHFKDEELPSPDIYQ